MGISNNLLYAFRMAKSHTLEIRWKKTKDLLSRLATQLLRVRLTTRTKVTISAKNKENPAGNDAAGDEADGYNNGPGVSSAHRKKQGPTSRDEVPHIDEVPGTTVSWRDYDDKEGWEEWYIV
ncbi:uncharacterized protein CC84DRAFT_1210093 [Paraphaeosphaeria sporulosa]|uniref:Uncharacterized protein n=1 Tax=Paraphaeosphaeria sporulosa TaxID=1460663 RepID=A0A177BWG1_9PLEO|nr:uncharacterized protein CC84DRAFT_1210093 [Paraphaeosphaeria sporulosa]OAF99823.1 hypothetical protein CC84DRAFT_1210093 [Paraphaeosphaeria sporulosa]